jgi:hydroxyethylthiazole kinase-like uncharacterized protein yjeF
MIELLTSAQMRAIEQAAMAAGSVTGLDLMERAGRGVLAAVLRWRPLLAQGAHRAHVLCGPGNNGGDGYVIARLLAARGWQVTVFALGAPTTQDAQANAARWDGPVMPLRLDVWRGAGEADLYVDALFGTGLTRAPVGDALEVLQYWGGNAAFFRSRSVAVDAPSGLCLDSGRPLAGTGTLPAVGLTVTFECPKLGHYLAEGPEACAALDVVDLGLARWRGPASEGETEQQKAYLVTREVAPGTTAPILRFDKSQGHKYSHGHMVVVSGGMGRSGAARLAARGALRVGSGAVTVAAPGSAMLECAAQLTAIMLRKCDSAEDLSTLLKASRASVLVIGPGFGLADRHADCIAAALRSRLPCVLDADALTLLAERDDLRALLHPDCVLTPHMGEFRRLFPDLEARLLAPAEAGGPAVSKVDVARAAAKALGCTVLLKGADTVVADGQGPVFVHAAVYDRAAPWLATAGAGDVLAGLIAGQIAQGAPGALAAAQGAWLHAEAARAFGPGLIAEDLSEQIPQVLRQMESAPPS